MMEYTAHLTTLSKMLDVTTNSSMMQPNRYFRAKESSGKMTRSTCSSAGWSHTLSPIVIMERSHASDHDDSSTDGSDSSQDGLRLSVHKGKSEKPRTEPRLLGAEAAKESSQKQDHRREMNRLSKMRCRKRKHERLSNLQAELSSLSQQYNVLRAENEQLRQEFSDILKTSTAKQGNSAHPCRPAVPDTGSTNQFAANSSSYVQAMLAVQREASFAESQPNIAFGGWLREDRGHPATSSIPSINSLNQQDQILRLAQNFQFIVPPESPNVGTVWNLPADRLTLANSQQGSPYAAHLGAILMRTVAAQARSESHSVGSLQQHEREIGKGSFFRTKNTRKS